MRLEAGIAWRYLRKEEIAWRGERHSGGVGGRRGGSHGGPVCVLSVFNGFRDILVSQSDRILPDIEVTPVKGKVIADADSLVAVIGEMDDVELASPAIAEQALAIYGQREMPVIVRGVDPQAFRRYTEADSLIVAGNTLPWDAIDYDPPASLISVGVASRLQCLHSGESLFLLHPAAKGASILPIPPHRSIPTVCG